eukprot:TRINITY_DN701_c0_g3_i9.p1 TRINITY_DN701_c0_g3~~TRINITY_DN701_c0_g3_i9.p1  ORF type:complete len:1061 (-),score=229.16 TRINITY_DN701_c0_g3_i9:484-3666(-)
MFKWLDVALSVPPPPASTGSVVEDGAGELLQLWSICEEFLVSGSWQGVDPHTAHYFLSMLGKLVPRCGESVCHAPADWLRALIKWCATGSSDADLATLLAACLLSIALVFKSADIAYPRQLEAACIDVLKSKDVQGAVRIKLGELFPGKAGNLGAMWSAGLPAARRPAVAASPATAVIPPVALSPKLLPQPQPQPYPKPQSKSQQPQPQPQPKTQLPQPQPKPLPQRPSSPPSPPSQDTSFDLLQALADDSKEIRRKAKIKADATCKVKILDLPLGGVKGLGKKLQVQVAPSPQASLSRLHKVVLSWDYYHMELCHKNANKLRSIPLSFSNFAEYKEVFEPLLLEEFAAQIQKSIDESIDTPEITARVESSGTESEFHFVTLRIPSAVPAATGNGAVPAAAPSVPAVTWDIRDGTLVLLSHRCSHGDGKVLSLFAISEERERERVERDRDRCRERDRGDRDRGLRVKYYLPVGDPRHQRLSLVDSEWRVKKITALATATREWKALYSCMHFPLLPMLLAPASGGYPSTPRRPASEAAVPSPFGKRERSLSLSSLEAVPAGAPQFDPRQFLEKLHYNDSQADAIVSCVTGAGFKLLQGPPGTGKTKTVVGLLSVLLILSRQNASTMPTPPSRPLVPGDARRVTHVRSSHLLVCAPSNAAVDELVVRIKHGLVDEKGEKFVPKILRLGQFASLSPAVHDVSLDSMLEALSKKDNSNLSQEHRKHAEMQQKIDALRKQLSVTCDQIHELSEELHSDQISEERDAELRRKLTALYNTKKRCSENLTQYQNLSHTYPKRLEMANREMKQTLLNNAQIICTTLSGSGHDVFSLLDSGFETVIVDEAAQAVEISSLIPLQYGVKRCVLVGDPAQLPATVLSRTAAQHMYEQSLLQRLKECHVPNSMLTVQYRMHWDIRQFPSEHFYQGRLVDAPTITKETHTAPFHADPRYGPFMFFDVVRSTETRGSAAGTSHANAMEAAVVVQLLSHLAECAPVVLKKYTVGIITPYRQQMLELKRRLDRDKSLATACAEPIEVNTVDGFQGREKDVILFSCVRAPVGAISAFFF